jgi:hypothetical protein
LPEIEFIADSDPTLQIWGEKKVETIMDAYLEKPQQENAKAKTQLYLQHVNQLYTNIQNWLQDEPLVLENGKIDVN